MSSWRFYALGIARSRPGLLIALIVVGLAGASLASAHNGDAGLIHSCVDNQSGNVRLTEANTRPGGPPNTRECGRSEFALDWPAFTPTPAPTAPPAWQLSGNGGTNPASNFVGTTDNQALEARANNQRVLRLEPHQNSSSSPGQAAPNIVGGANTNSLLAGVIGVTIAGGGSSTAPNRAEGDFVTIGGGAGNNASGVGIPRPGMTIAGGVSNQVLRDYGAIGGGEGNRAGLFGVCPLSPTHSTIAGGKSNVAGAFSAVGGGHDNNAACEGATIPGGTFNVVGGVGGFAAGTRARAQFPGSFAWADVDGVHNFDTTAAQEFAARARGGVRFVTQIDGSGNPTFTCAIPGNGAGGLSCSSDRDVKTGLELADHRAVLARLAEVPVYRWAHRDDPTGTPHLGPTAQDFYAAFGLGASDRAIGFQDADGVAFAAIQGLYELVQEHEVRWAAATSEVLADRVAHLDAELTAQRSLNAGLLAQLKSQQEQLAALQAQVTNLGLAPTVEPD